MQDRESMSKGCPECAMSNPDDASFCRACGAALTPAAEPAAPACRQCGAPLRAGARFCARCGADQTKPPNADEPTRNPAVQSTPPARSAAPIGPPESAAGFTSSESSTQPAAHDTPAPTPHVALPDAADTVAPDARRPAGWRMTAVGAVIAVAAGSAWWLNQARAPATPGGSAAAPPSPAGARAADAIAPAALEAPMLTLPVLPVVPAARTPAAPVSPASATPPALGEPSAPGASAASPGVGPSASGAAAPAAPAMSGAAGTIPARAGNAKAPRDELRLARSRDAAEDARHRADAPRPVAAARPPSPAPAVPPRAARALGVQARCAGRNPVLQAICEARECIGSAHANDAVCQRVRADEDRRRQQH